jgi:hypothetical protein
LPIFERRNISKNRLHYALKIFDGGEKMIFLKSHKGEGDYVPYAGIKAEPTSSDGKSVKIIYDGLLAKSGADRVFLHLGIGKRTAWKDINDIHLDRTNKGWESSAIKVKDQLNFCFKDSANNWDNNQGENWSYIIE